MAYTHPQNLRQETSGRPQCSLASFILFKHLKIKMNKNMVEGCAKDKTTNMTDLTQIRQGWHVHVVCILLHLTLMASNDIDRKSNSKISIM